MRERLGIKTAEMSSGWIPSRVFLDGELPATLDARFASIKQDGAFLQGCRPQCIGALKSPRTGEPGNDTSVPLVPEASSPLAPVRINHRAQIDVIEMKGEEKEASTCRILVYEEQHTKLVVLRSLDSDDACAVASELVDIVTTIGAPRIIQSGNGRAYAERVVREIRRLLRDFCVVHGDATRTASEERRDFRLILRAWMNDHPGRSLRDALRVVQVAENTRPNSRNGAIPSQLFFGRNICEDLCRTIGAKGPNGNVFTAKRNARQGELSSNFRQKSPETLENAETTDNREQEKIECDEGVEGSDERSRTKRDEKNEEKGLVEGNEESHFIGRNEEKYFVKRNEEKDLERNDEKDLQGRNEEKVLREKCPERHTKKTNEEKGSKEPNVRGSKDSENRPIRQKISVKKLSRKASRKSYSRSAARGATRNNSHLECTYCKQVFNFPSVLKRHMRSHTNERPYVCELCDKSFKQLGHLSQHALTHTDYRSFRCDDGCAVKFDSLESLKLHSCSSRRETDATLPPPTAKRRDTLRLFECDICKKVFTTKSVLERHVYTHTHERKYACKICGKRFKQAGHVKSHMLVHTGERKFSCNVCSRRFSLSNSLKKHMYVHNGDKPYQCDVCGSRFLEKRNLNGHLMTHTNERPHSCKICGKRYTLADTLRRHVSATHEDGRTYQCEICAKMFKQLAHLSVHKKVHNDERPFQCHLCEKNFKHKNVLKSHLAVHANVRPFECDLCKATFVRKTNLQTHIASAHMNERPYACTICNKRFKQISHLNGHIVVHSNSMPYQCDFCDRRCNRLDNLKKHMRLHTKSKE